jgi:LacI family gluconate utilization system Gnt-I transcriptional repressor
LLSIAGIPIVETFDMTPKPIDMLVGISHERMSAEVCRYLAERGCKRLALMSGSDQRAIRRKNAFLKVAKSMGLPPPATHLSHAPPTHARGRAALSDLLAEHPDIDAVWCSSDMLALGAITEAQERGISIPDTLSIIGAGDVEFAATVRPSITSVKYNEARLGTAAAQAIIDRVEGREVSEKVVDVGFSIVSRESA